VSASKSKKKTFNIMVDIKGQFVFEVSADNLKQALELAMAMKPYERVATLAARRADWNDYETEIVGVF